MGHRSPRPDPARRHAAEARRLPGGGQDPGGGGDHLPRPDHHADRRARGGAEGPRPARRGRRLPHQAVPPGRVARPHQEPARPVRAQGRPARPAAARSRPRVLRRQGRRRHDDHRHQRRDRPASRARPQGLPRRRQPAVRRPPGLPRPRAGPQEHRRHRHGAVDGPGPRPPDPRQARLGRGPAARAAVAGDRRAGHAGAPADHPRASAGDVRLRRSSISTSGWTTSTSASSKPPTPSSWS